MICVECAAELSKKLLIFEYNLSWIHPPTAPTVLYRKVMTWRSYISHYCCTHVVQVYTRQKQLLIQLLHCANLKPHPISTMVCQEPCIFDLLFCLPPASLSLSYFWCSPLVSHSSCVSIFLSPPAYCLSLCLFLFLSYQVT